MYKMKSIISIFVAILLLIPVSAMAASEKYIANPQSDHVMFIANPKTAYAAFFIMYCEGQQYFMDEIERLLNMEGKTLNTVASANDFSNIKSLGLDDAGVTGKIPSAIGQLTELEYLFLGGNALSGAIPAELYSLAKLKNIDLSDNSFSGAIPSAFGTMPSLTTLILKGNRFSGTIPDSILSNEKIQVLNLMDNQLSGTIPARVNQMTGLEYLNLSENEWRGSIPDLSRLINLIALSLWDCSLTGTIHNSIFALMNLQILDLADNGFSGEIPSQIGNLTELQFLSLSNNKFTGTIPASISNLEKLQTVNLSQNKITGLIPDIFGSSNLTSINLASNYLRGTVPDTLKARYEDGAGVTLTDNYLTGTVLSSMSPNDKNFVDGLSTHQYQLISSKTTVQIGKTATTDLYPLLKNKYLDTGNITQKRLLNPEEYNLTYDDSKIGVTVSTSGIFVKALTDITQSDDVEIEIMIAGNEGSNYSKTTIKLTTEKTTSTHSGTGGSNGTGSGNGNGSGTGSGNGSSDGNDNHTDDGGGGNNGEEQNAPVAEEPIKVPIIQTHKAFVNGYEDSTFRPEGNVTRGEIAKMIIMALDIAGSTSAVSAYGDVSNDGWAFQYIEEATDRGFLNGYEDGAFGSENAMTRAELVTCLVRVATQLGKTMDQDTVPFSDVGEDQWYNSYVAQAAQLGLTRGYEDGTFRPNNTVTRAEAVTMINRLLDRTPEETTQSQTTARPFTDVPASHWAYWEIYDASNT